MRRDQLHSGLGARRDCSHGGHPAAPPGDMDRGRPRVAASKRFSSGRLSLKTE
jgi:hypothetical protein